MAIKEATDATFEELVLKNDKPVVVDFWAVWCGPCKLVAPEMEKLAAKYEGIVDVVKVDVDKNPGLSQAYQIMSIPTIAYFKPGDQPRGVVGFQPMESLEKKFGLAELHASRGRGGRQRRLTPAACRVPRGRPRRQPRRHAASRRPGASTPGRRRVWARRCCAAGVRRGHQRDRGVCGASTPAGVPPGHLEPGRGAVDDVAFTAPRA